MSEPIVLVSHLRVKEGKLEGYKQSAREVWKMMEATKPGTVVHLGYVNEDGTKVSFIHVFPDADSMDRHMEGVEDRVKMAFEFLETAGYEVYGTPSKRVLEMMKQEARSAIPLSMEPGYLGGYMRLKSG